MYKVMKFTFSPKFRQLLYQQILAGLGAELDNYRLILGINVKEMMQDIHLSHLILKKY
jgi:hypothetical protein